LPRAGVDRLTGLRVRWGERDLGSRDPFEILSLPAGDSDGVLHWRGSFYLPWGHAVELLLAAPELLEVRIGGVSLPRSRDRALIQARLELPQGWHSFELRQGAAGSRQPWSMSLRVGGLAQKVGREDFTPATDPGGLLATYRQDNGTVSRVLDPQLNSAADERLFARPYELSTRMPFSAAWRGQLRIDDPGDYELELHTTGPARLAIDGERVFAIDKVPEGGHVLVRQSRRTWAAGLYDLEATWRAELGDPPSWRRIFQLYWTPPGGVRQLIPAEHYLRPGGALQPSVTASRVRWCEDDCNRDGRWTVDELLTVVSIAAGSKPLAVCRAADASGDGLITVDEVVKTSNKVLKGCH
jgi:hypothetical protein